MDKHSGLYVYLLQYLVTNYDYTVDEADSFLRCEYGKTKDLNEVRDTVLNYCCVG